MKNLSYEEGLSNVCICVYVSKELYVCVVLDVIDLTGDDKDDLQRAIALSLEESSRAFRETGITDEEQAISRYTTVAPSAGLRGEEARSGSV